MVLIKRIILLLTKGDLKFIIHAINKRLKSEVVCFGLKRDLNDDFKSPEALIDLNIRLSKDSDHTYFSEDNTNFGLVEKNIKSCYVATNKLDEPFFRIWLMGFSENEKIQNFFDGNFPKLKENEALLESAFTIARFRGKGIMPKAMSIISEKAINIGARYILIFVNIENIPSLKGCYRSGFQPYILRREKWFLFKKNVFCDCLF